jgi:hypothetical protein
MKGPSVPKMSPLKGRRVEREQDWLSPLTMRRARTDPSPLAVRFTKFKQNFMDPMKLPRDILHPSRKMQDNRYHLDVGQVPED